MANKTNKKLMAAEVISKKKVIALPSAEDGQFARGIGIDLQRKTRSFRLQFIGAGPYGCRYAPAFLNLIWLANPLLKNANVCGPPDLRAVTHRLRTSGLDINGFVLKRRFKPKLTRRKPFVI